MSTDFTILRRRNSYSFSGLYWYAAMIACPAVSRKSFVHILMHTYSLLQSAFPPHPNSRRRPSKEPYMFSSLTGRRVGPKSNNRALRPVGMHECLKTAARKQLIEMFQV